jgi:hypothetical protein
MEILLMKIKSKEGGGIDCCNFIARRTGNGGMEAVNAEAYADDLTIIFKMTREAVGTVMRLLNQFSEMTGLEVNKEKTQLMVGGVDDWQEGHQVCGVTIVNKVKLLGIGIDRKLEKLDENWDEVISRMRRLSGYWCNFGLSITGRVMVAKTYLVSQAIYLMGVLPMSQVIGDMMNEILVNFVSGRGRPIERQRQLLEEECGGYGMIDMNIMNMCIKSTWIRRAKDMELSAPDYIGAMLMEEGGIEYDQIGRRNEVSEIGIVGSDIMKQWVKFNGLYYDIGSNV